MKKIIKSICCGLVVSLFVVGAGACHPKQELNAVQLIGINAAEMGVLSDADYYIAPEPAVTTKINALKKQGKELYNVGSLQELYGETDGYPQAVIVAKRELIETDGAFLSQFISKVNLNTTYLQTADTVKLVNAIQQNFDTEREATFKPANLNRTVIENCNISYVASYTCKDQVKNYIQKLSNINRNAVGELAEDFFCTSYDETTVNDRKLEVSIYAPDGAPALALANLLVEEHSFDKQLNYQIVLPETIASKVNGAGVADLCILPSNLAAKLLGTGQTYQMLGTVTHGNLFLLSSMQATINKGNLTDLCGKKVYVVNLANVPGLTFKAILNDNKIPYTEDAMVK